MDGRTNGPEAGAWARRASRRRVLGVVGGGLATASFARPAAAQCDLVELYPGYPGYRGFVTGLDGVGDHACLGDLVAAVPGFSPASERLHNLAAARRLGLAGEPEEWTWENWLAVEAERGLVPPTCYACALAGATTRPEPVGTPVADDDPRLMLDGYGTDWAFARVIPADPVSPIWSGVRQAVPYDHHARRHRDDESRPLERAADAGGLQGLC